MGSFAPGMTLDEMKECSANLCTRAQVGDYVFGMGLVTDVREGKLLFMKWFAQDRARPLTAEQDWFLLRPSEVASASLRWRWEW